MRRRRRRVVALLSLILAFAASAAFSVVGLLCIYAEVTGQPVSARWADLWTMGGLMVGALVFAIVIDSEED